MPVTSTTGCSRNVRDRVQPACGYRARAYGLKDAIEVVGIPLLDDYRGHPSVRNLMWRACSTPRRPVRRPATTARPAAPSYESFLTRMRSKFRSRAFRLVGQDEMERPLNASVPLSLEAIDV